MGWVYVLFCLAAPVGAYHGGRVLGGLDGPVWARWSGYAAWCALLWPAAYVAAWRWAGWPWLSDWLDDKPDCPPGQMCIEEGLSGLALVALFALLGLAGAVAAMWAADVGIRAGRRRAGRR